MTGNESSEHRDWEARLGRIAESVKSWRVRTSEDPIAAQPGSELAGDDIEFVELSVSSLAAYSITVATEHLDFCLSVMAATHTLYPSAYLTVLRTALLTASQAVWVLDPVKRPTRQVRTLRLVADDVRSQLAMTRDAYAVDSHTEDLKSQEVRRLTARQRRLQEIADQLGLREDVRKMRVNNTEVIEEAARSSHEEDDVVGGVNLIWRTGSAAAHGTRSFALLRVLKSGVKESKSGAHFAKLTGDLATDVGPAAAASTMALNRAFELFDLRGSNRLPA